MPRVWVTRHITRLVVDYFSHAARLGASARRAARRRLLRLRRMFGCLGSSLGTSRGSSSTTSPRAGSSWTTSPTPRVRVPRHVAQLVTRLVVDYFDYAARPGASARRAAHHATRCSARRRLFHLVQARRSLLRLRRVPGCHGTSRGSSLTTSPTPCIRVPRHVARHVAWLVVDYFTYAALKDRYGEPEGGGGE
jgi:hypothetical protein